MTPRIRLASEEDAAVVPRIYAPIVEETTISFETTPPAESEIADRIASTLERYPWLVCDAGGVVGYAYAGAHRSRGPTAGRSTSRSTSTPITAAGGSPTDSTSRCSRCSSYRDSSTPTRGSPCRIPPA